MSWSVDITSRISYFFDKARTISLDSLQLTFACEMFALYAEVVSRYQTEKTDTDDIVESDTIESLYLLKETAEDVRPCSHCYYDCCIYYEL